MAECLQLTELMCRKLPAQLRNSVYHYLCIEEQPIPVGPYYHFKEYDHSSAAHSELALEQPLNCHLVSWGMESPEPADVETVDNFITLPDGRIKYDHSEKPPADILMPNNHIFDPKYVGTVVASEAQVFYYSNNTFSICNVEEGIDRFLKSAQLIRTRSRSSLPHQSVHSDVIVKPWDYVHDLQIRIKYEHINTFIEHTYDAAVLSHAAGSPDRMHSLQAAELALLHATKASIDMLPRLPSNSRPLNIEFIIMTDFTGNYEGEERRFANLLEALRNTIYELIHDREHALIRVIHHDMQISAFPRDLTQLWSLTKEQWEHEKSACNGWSDCMSDFYLEPGPLVIRGRDAGSLERGELALLSARWGITHVLKDTKPRWAIKEGKYWPVRHHICG